MIKSIKIRLIPTFDQEILMKKSVGVARFSYNFGLAKWEELYKKGEKPTGYTIKEIFNNTIKKQEEYSWIKQVSSQITAQAFADLQDSFNSFFKGKTKYPNFKIKKKSRQIFYVRYDRMNIKNNTVNIEKIGRVKYKTNYTIPKLKTYINPRCHYDGKYWYLTFGFEQGENQVELNKDLSIGIDLGITNLAIVSHLDQPIKNINKSSKVKKLEKKLKRLQRKVSRKYEMNKNGKEFVKTNNIIKLEKQIKLIHRQLTNIRTNHIHQATNAIIKLKPYRVVMENLNITGMMKNKHLSKAIANQKLYEFKRQMKYKSQFNGIEFVQVDRFYPSSKTCSRCGNIKKDLKLKDRTYSCECGLNICRDKNASLNLSKYQLKLA
ncbi:RNA-guided endonuclease InsQ/TnpB family protein [Tissierella creatinophila]|uniref:Putative transposase n=1 Tax=Tissierella creatinophila DSM 6911 TaxID=1123403 RepID=A0A1U7M667_TISCR|nr:RNA-guided endonuclease TnpB family protein [Tissierella creatinophila]OLS02750.1 putative transposase [Tissierella creatinophila DSM 6911]